MGLSPAEGKPAWTDERSAAGRRQAARDKGKEEPVTLPPLPPAAVLGSSPAARTRLRPRRRPSSAPHRRLRPPPRPPSALGRILRTRNSPMPAFMGCESVEIEVGFSTAPAENYGGGGGGLQASVEQATSEAWNLRASVIEAHDLRVPAPSPGLPFDVRVKIKIGFQSARTQRSVASTSSGSAFAWEWEEDLMFVVSEPLDESLIVLVKDRSMIKEPARRGARPTSALLPAKEAAHVCSEYRPTAKQQWKPPVGVLELGIIGACGLLSTKTKGGAKYSTDAYCVAKYGKKWVRKRTVTDSPTASTRGGTSSARGRCTTRARCSRWRVFADDRDERQDYRIRKVRSYETALTGVQIHGVMHYLRPIGVAQQETLRAATVRLVAARMERSETPLGREVVRHMLDVDAHTWSVRRAKANWFRILGVLTWAVGLARWRSSSTTVLVHVLYQSTSWSCPRRRCTPVRLPHRHMVVQVPVA
uniref:C2 domain-containing protein n=1 Tax=Oryza glumipatula TaxID=40148 RepID=A0A0E0B3M9_9ORYZ